MAPVDPRTRRLAALAALGVLALSFTIAAARSPDNDDDTAPVAVRYAEGLVHGFLVLRQQGTIIAHGDLLQVARKGAVESRMVFRFKDGSLLDESVVYTQKDVFVMQRFHSIQRGPAFDADTDFRLDRATRSYRVLTTDRAKGRTETDSGTIDFPVDVANGMVIILAKNLAPDRRARVHYVALTPKPRLIELEMTPAGSEKALHGPLRRTTSRYTLHPKLGTLLKLAAKIMGKVPPDSHVWTVIDDAPAFLRFRGAMFMEGPEWEIEQSIPTLPRSPSPR